MGRERRFPPFLGVNESCRIRSKPGYFFMGEDQSTSAFLVKWQKCGMGSSIGTQLTA